MRPVDVVELSHIVCLSSGSIPRVLFTCAGSLHASQTSAPAHQWAWNLQHPFACERQADAHDRLDDPIIAHAPRYVGRAAPLSLQRASRLGRKEIHMVTEIGTI